ncbi:hypothetical protein GF325_19315 [Candidatus Bathyarchaeota archaeon]|nr:hypothetical protein [Candidatus Bathyarchaeota archaeon]
MSDYSERSLVLLKPDAVLRLQVGVEILKEISAMEGIQILAFRETTVSPELAMAHYKEHEGKSFFPWLLNMITAPIGVCVLILEGKKGMVKQVRELIGPTYIRKAIEEAPNSLRARFGIIKGINVAHASDAPRTGNRETDLWIKHLGLKLDAREGKAAMDAYISKHDGTHPDRTNQVRQLTFEIQEHVEQLKEVLSAETSRTKEEIVALVDIILSAIS